MHIIERTLSKTLNSTETIFVRPEHIDATFRIDVTRCGSASKGDWNGVIGLDGDMTNGALHGVYSMLTLGGELPPTIVVSVSFTDSGPYPNTLARNTHLTHRPWPEFDRIYCNFYGRTNGPPTGQADKFLDFLADELQPFIQEQFGVDPSKWTLTGISFGGLFTLYALVTRPTQFARYNAVSASAWFKNPSLFELAEQFASSSSDIDVRAYLTVGDHEDGVRNDMRKLADAMPAFKPILDEYLSVIGDSPDQVSETLELGKIIKRRAGCQSRATVMPNETHASVYFVALSQGLRWLHSDAAD